jgi:uncharacterized protein (DUF58 family)
MLSYLKARFKQGSLAGTGNSDGALTPVKSFGPYCDLQQLMALRWAARSISLPKASRVSRPQAGAHRSRFRGRGMEFSEVRTYQPGDDVRSIDWRVTARRQKPHTKLFNEERERPILLICDQSHSQFFGSTLTFKSVKAAEIAALFAWTALNQNDRVGGIVFSDHGHEEIRPARNRKSILRLLSVVCQFNQALRAEPVSPSFGLNEALVEANRLSRPGTLVVVISDFLQLDERTTRELSNLCQHNELILAQTYDPLDRILPPPGVYPVSDGQDTLVVDSHSESVRSAFSNWAEEQNTQLKSLATRYRAPLVQIATDDDPLKKLQSLLVSMR